MPAAEAKKAGIVSEITRLTPRPPCLIGIEACSHRMSDRAEFVMRQTAGLRRSSEISSKELLTDVEQRNKRCTLDALNEALIEE